MARCCLQYSFNPQDSLFNPCNYTHLKIRKSRHREVKLVVQGHEARRGAAHRICTQATWLWSFCSKLLDHGASQRRKCYWGTRTSETQIHNWTTIRYNQFKIAVFIWSRHFAFSCLSKNCYTKKYKDKCMYCVNTFSCTEVDDKHFNSFNKYQILAFTHNVCCYMLV